MSPSHLPLEGVTILDLTTMLSGPLATGLLAQQGADVIKVESLEGDQLRRHGPLHKGLAACFHSTNKNKRSLSVDLRTDQGQEIVRGLAAASDVIVQNFRPGVIDRLGLGLDDVRAVSPDSVYCSISGFGWDGPFAGARVYDPVIQSIAGSAEIHRDRATGRPRTSPVLVADKVTALSAAEAIVAALFARERSGQPQHVELNMLSALVSFLFPQTMVGIAFAEAEFDISQFQGSSDELFQTADGGWITASAVSDTEWEALAAALGRPDWVQDARFSSTARRIRNSDELRELLGERISESPSETIIAALLEHDAVAAPVHSLMDLASDDQIAASQALDIYHDDVLGEVRQPSGPARFNGHLTNRHVRAPLVGEHTREILEAAGHTQGEIDALLEAGIVGDGASPRSKQ